MQKRPCKLDGGGTWSRLVRELAGLRVRLTSSWAMQKKGKVAGFAREASYRRATHGRRPYTLSLREKENRLGLGHRVVGLDCFGPDFMAYKRAGPDLLLGPENGLRLGLGNRPRTWVQIKWALIMPN